MEQEERGGSDSVSTMWYFAGCSRAQTREGLATTIKERRRGIGRELERRGGGGAAAAAAMRRKRAGMYSESDSSTPTSEMNETLEFTPTWVVAVVCTVIVVISLFVERFIHYLGQLLKRKQQDALFEALQKIKEECRLSRRPTKWKEAFAQGADSHPCTRKGKVQMLSLEALHQLHIFIFVLAVSHVAFSASTMVLGGAKIRQWKHWEIAIRKDNIDKEQSSEAGEDQAHYEFVKERTAGVSRKSVFMRWMTSFLKQFHASVTKSDYRALRSGFIMMHCSSNKNFDFHKYMMRALEDDFRMVVGISWYLWLFVVVFLLLNVKGWHTYFWLSFLPLIFLLAVGTKLEHIITTMAHEVAQKFPTTDQESQGVKPSDHHFWFHSPGIVLYLIHFILFQNAFELAFVIWIWKLVFVIPRIIVGLTVQVLCSYSTLPLYAIVTQMGDMFKQDISAAPMRSVLQIWAEGARKRKRSSASGGSALQKLFGPKVKKGEQSGTGIRSKPISDQGQGSQNSHGQSPFAGVMAAAIQKNTD
ncbi:hypothetical protein HPP92_018922 [Vanilla planifolia]|uniref:MLO-like protein n=1 Tax=Vanilla planifolia TaxID=51239 RepID=A0A835QDU9_VANPL|nr:hypothetical protein HPP92_018922 [Vanilla planifolia]